MELTWSVEEFEKPLILGDSPVLLIKKDSEYGIFHDSIDKLENVVMPIGTYLAVFGSIQTTSLDSDTLNTMSASASMDYYISEHANHGKYRLLIGSRTGIQHSRDWKEEALAALNVASTDR